MRRGDSYGLLLILIVITYTFIAVLDFGPWSRVIVGALFSASLLLALHTSRIASRWVRISSAIVGAYLLALILDAAFGNEPLHWLAFGMLLPIAAAPIAILTRILGHERVSLETILGAICAYVMVGLMFATFYALLNEVSGPFFVQPAPPGLMVYLYFSFVTLTTLGFGDYTPGTSFGQVVVSIEALLGQLFLVTLVARLVGNLGTSPPGRVRPPDAPLPADDQVGDG
jgi:hypothetical protein